MFGTEGDYEHELDRNGEPCEDGLGCLVMLVCLAGIFLIVMSALIGFLASCGR